MKYCIVLLLFISCTIYNRQSAKQNIFTSLKSDKTGVDFVNKVTDTDSLNILDYLYFYNGGGVAVADFNNDGLNDIYFVSNQHANALYLNKGNFEFEDITEKAKVGGTGNWNTGVTVVDINADGWLDIYLSTVDDNAVFKGHNQLYINNKNLTFSESSQKYGLDLRAYSTQASFFDYDKDGDLDCYILTHSVHNNESYGQQNLRHIKNTKSGDYLFENKKGYFVDVTQKSGIIQSSIGYGLGLSIEDFNNDGWDDIYVSNDFFENDYYYINQKNGKFKEQLRTSFGHVSQFSMGNTSFDVNKDGYMDILTTDMLPNSMYYIKSTVMNESYDQYLLKYRWDYYYQNSKNSFQLNVGDGEKFVDFSLMKGVSSTDWTWSPVSEDFNMDGYQDLFFATGIKKRMNDIDYIKYMTNPMVSARINENKRIYDKQIIDQMPEGIVNNILYIGTQKKYKDVSALNDMIEPTYSSGAVAVDLDNDGDLDLVTNNTNQKAILYENTTINTSQNTKPSINKYFNFNIRYQEANPFGIGTQLYFKTNHSIEKKSIQTSTAFQSNKHFQLQFVCKDDQIAEEILILWPNFSYQIIKSDTLKNINHISYNPSKCIFLKQEFISQFLDNYINKVKPSSYEKWETLSKIKIKNHSFNDFNTNYLLPHMYSKYAPPMLVLDLDNDNNEDVFLGTLDNKNDRKIFFINDKGELQEKPFQIINNENHFIDGDAIQCDVNFDGKQDIVISNYSFSHPQNIPAGRIYINRDDYTFEEYLLPSTNAPVDFIFPISIPQEQKTLFIIINKKDYVNFNKITGNYIIEVQNDMTSKILDINTYKHFYNNQFISDITILDYDGDQNKDFVVVSEWGKPIVYLSKDHFSKPHHIHGLETTFGLWQSINAFRTKNQTTFLLGNWGTNSKLSASKKFPLKMYIEDIDDNKQDDIIISYEYNKKYYPFRPKSDLENELPYMKKKYLMYRDMADKTTEEIFKNKLNESDVFKVTTLNSILYSMDDNGNFKQLPLPELLQATPLKQTYMLNEDDDHFSVLFNGNLIGVTPYEGRYDAMGLVRAKLSKQNDTLTDLKYIINKDINGKEMCSVGYIKKGENAYIVVMTHEGELLFMQKSNNY